MDIKQMMRNTDHSSPSNAHDKNEQRIVINSTQYRRNREEYVNKMRISKKISNYHSKKKEV
jgi:hypothetical protein